MLDLGKPVDDPVEFFGRNALMAGLVAEAQILRKERRPRCKRNNPDQF